MKNSAKPATSSNILMCEKLPQCVFVNGKKYPVKTDFRTWINFGKIMENSDLTSAEKAAEAVALCFLPPRLPKTLSGALFALCAFYSAPMCSKERRNSSEPLYDFFADAPHIYASFCEQYGIDLAGSKMHWHKFCALFCALSPEGDFGRIVAVRAADVSKIKDSSRRAALLRLKKIYSLGEKERDIGEALW